MNVVLYRPELDIGMLAIYRALRRGAVQAQQRFDKLQQQIDAIVGRIALEHCTHELELLDELRRQLRLLTTGVPLTEALTDEDNDPLLTSNPGFNQRQHDAMTQVLKRNYRLLAQTHHPDKGGDPEVWHQIDRAYKARNLRRLTDLWLSLSNMRNLYWQQSDGVEHASTEMEASRIDFELLQQTELFKAIRQYMAGSVNTAIEGVRSHLQNKVGALINEINYVTTKGSTNG